MSHCCNKPCPPNPKTLANLIDKAYNTLSSDFISFTESTYNITDNKSLVEFINLTVDHFTKPHKRGVYPHNQILHAIKKVFTMAIDWSLHLCKLLFDCRRYPRIEVKSAILPLAIVSASVSYVLYTIYCYIKKKYHTPKLDWPMLYPAFQRSLYKTEGQFAQLNHLITTTKLSQQELVLTILNLLQQSKHKIDYMVVWAKNNEESFSRYYSDICTLITVCSGYVFSYTLPQQKDCLQKIINML